jgi:uncharacterized protein (DUF488 family)
VRLFTVGHSNRSLAEFLALLDTHGIDQVADVRSYPGSKRYPQFDRLQLERELPLAGIEYVWVGENLGGMRDYAAHMKTDEFRTALEALVASAKNRSVACMCAEKIPDQCHRNRMSDALVGNGVEVWHLIDKETMVEHRVEDRPEEDRQATFF